MTQYVGDIPVQHIDVPYYKRVPTGVDGDGKIAYEYQKAVRREQLPAYDAPMATPLRASKGVRARGKVPLSGEVKNMYGHYSTMFPHNKGLQAIMADEDNPIVPTPGAWGLMQAVAVQDVDTDFRRVLTHPASAWDWIKRTNKVGWTVRMYDADGDGIEDDVFVLNELGQVMYINGYAVKDNNRKTEKYRAYLHGHPTLAMRRENPYRQVRRDNRVSNPFTIYTQLARAALKPAIDALKASNPMLTNAMVTGGVQKLISQYYRQQIYFPLFRKHYTNMSSISDEALNHILNIKSTAAHAPGSEHHKQIKRMINRDSKMFSRVLVDYIMKNQTNILNTLAAMGTTPDFNTKLGGLIDEVADSMEAREAGWAGKIPEQYIATSTNPMTAAYFGDSKYDRYRNFTSSAARQGVAGSTRSFDDLFTAPTFTSVPPRSMDIERDGEEVLPSSSSSSYPLTDGSGGMGQ